MKKIMFLLAIVLITTIAIVGCGNAKPESNGRENYDPKNPMGWKNIVPVAQKPGSVGTYVPSDQKAKNELDIKFEFVSGVMKSPSDPPPTLRVMLTNKSNGKVEIRRNPTAKTFFVQIISLDEKNQAIGDTFNVDLTLGPQETRALTVPLYSSINTKKFDISAIFLERWGGS